MSEQRTDRDQILQEIDVALSDAPALSEKQIADLAVQRKKIEALCDEGAIDKARREQAIILQVIRDGAPIKE